MVNLTYAEHAEHAEYAEYAEHAERMQSVYADTRMVDMQSACSVCSKGSAENLKTSPGVYRIKKHANYLTWECLRKRKRANLTD